MTIDPKSGKVLFFSDLHLGVHQNSATWHNIALDLADWIDEVAIQHKIDTIFFAGDVFHDRHEIGVNTLHTAKKFFDKLSKYKVHLLPGNHDAFLSSTVEVNSVEILESENVFVYTNPTTLLVGDKKVTFCPWKTDISNLEKVDMLVGHFEIMNFHMTATKICDHGSNSEDLLSKANCVVTGHFHTRDLRFYEDNKYILYLGSPYEMDFGDRGQRKGVSIIDFNATGKESIKFIENNKTPKHFRIKISEIIQKKYTNFEEMIKNNLISLYVDSHVDTLTLDLLIGKLTQYNPLQFRTEFNILDKAQVDTKEVKKLSIDIETAFHEFVEHIETKATKKEVLDKCLELYKMCQISHV